MTKEAVPINERLTFIFHKISARIGLIGSRHFEELGLNQYSARILVMLRELEEVRAGTLSDLMVQPQSTISTQLQSLQKRKLIRRRRLAEDNRAVIVTLTAEGLRLANDCDELSRRVQDMLVAGMSKEELRTGYAFLAKIDGILSSLDNQEFVKFRDGSKP